MQDQVDRIGQFLSEQACARTAGFFSDIFSLFIFFPTIAAFLFHSSEQAQRNHR